MLAAHLEPTRPKPWTRTAPLPGGDMEGADFDLFLRQFHANHAWLPLAQARRLARAYGTRAERVLGKARAPEDLGLDFGAGLYQAEIDYLMDQEWALTGEDVLWRRSKLGLRLSPSESAGVCAYVSARSHDRGAQT
jgi:glycerol-3-phosphate dehydrogenase